MATASTAVIPDAAPTPERARRSAGRRLLRTVGLIAAIAVAVVVLRGQVPGLGAMWAALRQADPSWLLLAAMAQAVSIELFARQQTSLLRGFGVPMSNARSLAITYASTAVSVTMPAGGVVAAGFTIQQWRGRGATYATAATVTVLSGVASFGGLALLYLVGTGAALAVHPGTPRTVPAPVLIAVAGSLAVAAFLTVALRRIRRMSPPSRPVAGARTWPAWVTRLTAIAVPAVRAARDVPRRYGVAALGYATANWLTDLLCLVFTARALHLGLDLVPLAGVYLAVQLIRQIPLTPGGVGLIETSLLAGLVAAGAGHADAAAVVLTYRLLSCWFIVPIGATTWAVLRRATTTSEPRETRPVGTVARHRPAKAVSRPVSIPSPRLTPPPYPIRRVTANGVASVGSPVEAHRMEREDAGPRLVRCAGRS